MKEFPPNLHESVQLPQNASVIELPGDMIPDMTPRTGYNSYRNSVDGQFYYQIFENEKEQFIASELIGTVVPVAPIFKKELIDGGFAYFSKDVVNHADYKEGQDEVSDIDSWFIFSMFGDGDHEPGHNHDGGIFQDFGHARLEADERTGGFTLDQRAKLTQGHFKKADAERAEIFIHKVQLFRNYIEGEEGLGFLRALIAKAEYRVVEPEEMQKTLLHRCDVILSNLI